MGPELDNASPSSGSRRVALQAVRLLIPFAVLVFGLALTGAAHLKVCRDATDETRAEFSKRAVEVRDRLNDRLEEYRSLLLAGRALVTSSEHVTRREWARLVRTIEMSERMPEVFGLALIDRVHEDRLDEWVEARRDDVSADFSLKKPNGAGDHPEGSEYFVIRYHEPEERNRPAWGLEVSREGPNRVPYEESLELGRLRMTPGISLVQSTGERESGVVIALPFTQEVRSGAGVRPGWVTVPVSLPGLISWLKQDVAHDVRVRLHETETINPEGDQLLADCTQGTPIEDWQSEWAVRKSLAFGGRDWSVEVLPSHPGVVAVNEAEGQRIVLFGVMLSVLLSTLIASLSGTRDRAESTAAERTRSLRKSESRYRSLFDNAPVCIKELNREGCILSMNSAGLDLLGVEDLCDAVGHTMDEFVTPSEFDWVCARLEAAFEGVPSKFNFHCETPGRGCRLFTTTLDPIEEPDGRIERLISVTSDITDRQNAIENLRESETRYRSLVDSAPVCIKELDLEGRITSINPEGLKIGALPDDSALIGMRLADVVIAEDREEVATEIARVAAGETRSFSYRFDRSDGERVVLETQVVPRRCDGGEPCCLISVAMDVTERDRNTERVLQLAEEARASSASKSAFLANMSHEIRTPMTAIIGFGEVLEETASESQREAVETIRQNSDHLLQLINDVLDLSKIESGRMTFGREPVNLRMFLDGLDGLMRHRAGTTGLNLQFVVSDSVPEHIATDEVRVRQIMINLIGNALKFTDEGRVTVRVSEGDEQGSLRIAVEDTGPGVDPARAESIFDAFVQGDDSQTRRHGGTGLGLAISRQLAIGLGGSLRLDTKYMGGARFVLDLVDTAVGGIAPVDQVEERAQVSIGEQRVLVADDCEDNRKLIAHHLRRAGHAVEVAEDGLEAVEKALASRMSGQAYDVILMDMQMPGLDGCQATTKLREAGYTGRIVALTAHAMSHERRRCLDAGCDEFETKPILRDRLLAVVAGAARKAA